MAERILTVTVNPAIDKTYVTGQFSVGDIARASEMYQVAGGKGLNVLRVLHDLGIKATGTGMLGGWEGHWIAEDLSKSGLSHAFYQIERSTRMTHTILESSTGTVTELREPGPTISPKEAEGFAAFMKELSLEYGHVILSGSLAPGLGADYYSKLAASVRANGSKVYVDTAGQALKEVLQANVHLVKINEREFRDWLGNELSADAHVPHASESQSEVEVLDGMRRLCDAGCQIAIVTMGAKGSYACDGTGTWRIDAPHITSVNTVGSGDSYLAGLVGALSRGASVTDACVLATAAAASNALHRVAGQVELQEIEELKPKVKVMRVE